jgi:hypothetical protein
MKKFRQAVLAAACEGRLTEAWREENQYSPVFKKDRELLLKTFENVNLDDLNFKFRPVLDLPNEWVY